MLALTATALGKRFMRRKLFTDLDISLTTGQSLVVSGANGSGKSTLLQILMGLQRPSHGKVTYRLDDRILNDQDRRQAVGFVAPYISLYDGLTAEENIKFFATVSGRQITGKSVDAVLEEVGLLDRRSDLVGEYSSGMKQRIKYAVATMLRPACLVLDEPTANLDEEGKRLVRDIIQRHRESSVIVIATNESEELELGQQQIRLG